jgi:hypothetical protein
MMKRSQSVAVTTDVALCEKRRRESHYERRRDADSPYAKRIVEMLCVKRNDAVYRERRRDAEHCVWKRYRMRTVVECRERRSCELVD